MEAEKMNQSVRPVRSGEFDHIPIIDFAAMAGADLAGKRRVAAELKAACISAGFFYIINHGIDSATLDNLFVQAKEFFELPLKSKLALHVKQVEHLIGYVGMREEGKDPANGDLHEAFDFVTEATEIDGIRVNADFRQSSNRWPTELPAFRESFIRYGAQIRVLTRRIFEAFALALDLDETYFESMTDHPLSLGRILHYPNQPPGDDQVGNGAHTDHECFTILCQQVGVQALEVQNKNGDWIEAPPLEGSFVVNIGDLMARWTNDLFTSTPHRVINRSGRARYSIPFFIGANPDAVIEVLPTCQTAQNPARYAPIITSDYVQGLIAKNLGVELV